MTLDGISNMGDFLHWTDALAASVATESEEDVGEERRRLFAAESPASVESPPPSHRRKLRSGRQLKASSTGGGGGGGGGGAGGGGGLGGGRSYLRTYNQIVGSIRLEGVMVRSDSCEWRGGAWNSVLLTARRALFWESDQRQPLCYGKRADVNIMKEPCANAHPTFCVDHSLVILLGIGRPPLE